MTLEIIQFTKIRSNALFKSVIGSKNFIVATDGKEVYYFGQPDVLCTGEYASSNPFDIEKRGLRFKINDRPNMRFDCTISCGVTRIYLRIIKLLQYTMTLC
jgi:hypothetical protein